MNVNLPDRLYGRLANEADSAGIKIPELISRLLDRPEHVDVPQPVEPSVVDDFLDRASVELPERPMTARDKEEATVVAAARAGWTTSEMVLAFGKTMTRSRINYIRNKYKEAI